MKRRTTILFLAAASVLGAAAQGTSYEEFRRGMYERYNNFREGMYERYDEFLAGAWADYEVIAGQKRSTAPKPRTAPRVPDAPALTPPREIKAPALPAPELSQSSAASSPGSPASPASQVANPLLSPEGARGVSRAKEQPSAPSDQSDKSESSLLPPFEFDFYGMALRIPDPGLEIPRTVVDKQDLAARWRALRKDSKARAALASLRALAAELKLNDYLTLEMTRSYVAARHPGAGSASRASLAHFLLVGMGYDVRLGITGDRDGVLLVPLRQDVAEHPFLKLDGKKYYLFMDKKLGKSDYARTTISTCDVTPDGTLAQVDCALTDLNLPYKPHHYKVDNGTLHIEGEINANIFPVLRRYPLMQTGDFARSTVQPQARREIVEQLAAQLRDKPRAQAVDELLKFIQSGFDYATDEEFHGYEKPYFLEENLFYPKNDCEDRAIFYTYMLWNVLGIPNHLIAYPGHESASLVLDDLPAGDSYTYEGRRYLISDPTYIGASTGQCMPAYLNASPVIDNTY